MQQNYSSLTTTKNIGHKHTVLPDYRRWEMQPSPFLAGVQQKDARANWSLLWVELPLLTRGIATHIVLHELTSPYITSALRLLYSAVSSKEVVVPCIRLLTNSHKFTAVIGRLIPIWCHILIIIIIHIFSFQ